MSLFIYSCDGHSRSYTELRDHNDGRDVVNKLTFEDFRETRESISGREAVTSRVSS